MRCVWFDGPNSHLRVNLQYRTANACLIPIYRYNIPILYIIYPLMLLIKFHNMKFMSWELWYLLTCEWVKSGNLSHSICSFALLETTSLGDCLEMPWKSCLGRISARTSLGFQIPIVPLGRCRHYRVVVLLMSARYDLWIHLIASIVFHASPHSLLFASEPEFRPLHAPAFK